MPSSVTPSSAAQLPERVGVRVGRAAVVADDRRAGEQPGDLEVPHHPARRGVPPEHVVRAEIALQRNGLQVFEQHAAVAVHDALGQPGRAGREQHPQRMVERRPVSARQPASRDASRRPTAVASGERAAPMPVDARWSPAAIGSPARISATAARAVVDPAAVAVAVGGEQHGRLELAEPAQRGARRVVHPAGRPDRAEARRGEERDDRLGAVGQVGRRRGRRRRRRARAARRPPTPTALRSSRPGARRRCGPARRVRWIATRARAGRGRPGRRS